MGDLEQLKFDMTSIVQKAKRLGARHVDGVSVNLPFLSISVKPDNTECRVANEVVIRLTDRRVLNAKECCDTCIDKALASVQEIRRLIVDKQVELSDAKDGALYLLLEMMAEGLRQFLTFEQRLMRLHKEPVEVTHPDFHRAPEAREAYFLALEALRSHLNRCVLEIAKIGNVQLPKTGMVMQYQSPWPLEQYEQPLLTGK